MEPGRADGAAVRRRGWAGVVMPFLALCALWLWCGRGGSSLIRIVASGDEIRAFLDGRLIVEGRVLDRNGKPLAHAWLDFWHADGRGRYDNKGYNLRGHQYADKNGRYRLETVRPNEYLFRAAHVHVKVRATEKSPVLTTQLFFPGVSKNTTDPIFEKLTVMDVTDTVDGQIAKFDFVVDVA